MKKTLLLLFIVVCSVRSQQTISLLELNDLHAHLTPHLEQTNQNDGTILLSNRGGIARIATLINQIKSNNPNTILMNIGDTYHGGAEALFSNGNDIVDIVNALGIDVGVPGNWDYAYGPTVTNARFGAASQADIKRPAFQMLAANAIYRDPPNITQPFLLNIIRNTFNYTVGEPFLPATTLIEKSGVKIGFIGLTSDIVERMHEVMAFNIAFTQGQQNYKTLIEQQSILLKAQGADLVVVMSELGLHKDKELADIIAQGSVDVFFSAHTHEITHVPLNSNSGALVVESGNDTWLGQMDVSFDANNQPTLFNWTLHAITDDISPDSAILNMVQTIRMPYLQASPNITIPVVTPEGLPANLSDVIPQPFPLTLKQPLNQVLASTDIALDRKSALESHFNNAFTDILKAWSGDDIAMTSGFRFDSAVIPSEENYNGDANDYLWNYEDNVLIKGDLLVEDAYRLFPAPFTIAQGQVTVERLKQIIEENLENVFSVSAFNQSGGWMDGFSGLTMTVNLCQDNGQRLVALEYSNGTPLLDTDTLTVTGCARPFDQQASTTLCAYDGFTNVTTSQHPDAVTGDLSAVDFFIYALENNFTTNLINRKSINDTSAIAQWPQSSFVQPLELQCQSDVIYNNGFE